MGERRDDEPRREIDLWAIWDKRLKDLSMFVFGAIGFFHELLVRGEPEVIILVAAGALMGVPLVMSADSKRRESHPDE